MDTGATVSSPSRPDLAGTRVAVFGLGYVGLPVIRACVNAGHTVIGVDIDEQKVSGLNVGKSHVDDVLDCEVADWLTRGFTPTTNAGGLTDIDVYVVCVPTPLTKAGGPDLGAVESAARSIEERLDRHRKPLVILESTTYPGTTEEVVKPILEKNGFAAGEDFHLAFSPERIDPGNQTWTFENTPKVVGGLTQDCTDRAAAFYEPITGGVVRTRGLKEAEMAKLLENTYRHVNIALVNELWKLSHELGIDIWDVIDAAETKPYGFQAFRPGPGVGGHCIPIDPNYLSFRVKSELGQPFRFVELAQEINASMPEFVVRRAQEKLNQRGLALRGSRVLVLGLTYKRNLADTRESPSVAVIRQLAASGVSVLVHDPYVESVSVGGRTYACIVDYEETARDVELVVLLQDHDDYVSIRAMLPHERFLDTRGKPAVK
jgi:nucleotide sugar dehydrogenase